MNRDCCPQGSAVLTERHRIKLRYGGGRAVLVTGPVTGRLYRFSGTEQLQLVDPHDAIAIVRNPLFRIEGVVEFPASDVLSARTGGGPNA